MIYYHNYIIDQQNFVQLMLLNIMQNMGDFDIFQISISLLDPFLIFLHLKVKMITKKVNEK